MNEDKVDVAAAGDSKGAPTGFVSLDKEMRRRLPQQPPPPKLYHYTAAEGLLGMVSQGTVVATNLSFMNDSSELTYAYNLLLRTLKVRRDTGSEAFEQKLAGDCVQVLEDYRGMVEVYGFCFSEEEDSLNQWRVYADRGRGFALEFDAPTLFQLNHTEDGWDGCPDAIRPVVYAEREQQHIINETFDVLADFAARPEDFGWSEERLVQGLPLLFGLYLGLLLPSFKNPAFREEREWRATTVHLPIFASDLEFRTARDGSITPFKRFRLSSESQSLPISSIIMGSQSPGTSEHAIRLLLRKHGYDLPLVRELNLRRSSLPLR